jgi:hypothetical protein
MLHYDNFFVSYDHPGYLLKATFSGYQKHGPTIDRWATFGWVAQ